MNTLKFLFYFNFEQLSTNRKNILSSTLMGFSGTLPNSKLSMEEFDEKIYESLTKKEAVDIEKKYGYQGLEHSPMPLTDISGVLYHSNDIQPENQEEVMALWRDFFQKEYPTLSLTPAYIISDIEAYYPDIVYYKITELVQEDNIKKTKIQLDQEIKKPNKFKVVKKTKI